MSSQLLYQGIIYLWILAAYKKSYIQIMLFMDFHECTCSMSCVILWVYKLGITIHIHYKLLDNILTELPEYICD